MPKPDRPRAGRVLKVAIPGVLGVLVAVTAAFGGFDQASAHHPKSYKPGATIDQHWFHTQVTGAYIAQAGGQQKGIPALYIRLRVRNMTDEPSWKDPIVTLGANPSTSSLIKDWPRSPTMRVAADGHPRRLLGATVHRTSGTGEGSLPPHVPVTVDTQWTLRRLHERPRDITVSLGDFDHTDDPFYDIPGYWTPVADRRASAGGPAFEKPRMVSTVALHLGRRPPV